MSPHPASGRWYKKLAGNRLHADRQVHAGRSEAYEYDELHRLVDYRAGKTQLDGSDPRGIADHWLVDRQSWLLDQTGGDRSGSGSRSEA